MKVIFIQKLTLAIKLIFEYFCKEIIYFFYFSIKNKQINMDISDFSKYFERIMPIFSKKKNADFYLKLYDSTEIKFETSAYLNRLTESFFC